MDGCKGSLRVHPYSYQQLEKDIILAMALKVISKKSFLLLLLSLGVVL
jgi:hypothetical protein